MAWCGVSFKLWEQPTVPSVYSTNRGNGIMKTTQIMMMAALAAAAIAPAVTAQVGGTVGASGGVTTGTGMGIKTGTGTGVKTGTGSGIRAGANTNVNADVPRDRLNVGTGLNAGKGRLNATGDIQSGYSSIRNSENVRGEATTNTRGGSGGRINTGTTGNVGAGAGANVNGSGSGSGSMGASGGASGSAGGSAGSR